MLTATGVSKTYMADEALVAAVRGVDLAIEKGEFVALTGPSGCGKSTLLHICGAMDRPTAGRVVFDGRDLSDMSDDELTVLRRTRIGFVFQFFNLLPTLTVEENIALPQMLAGVRPAEARARARTLAERIGLISRVAHYPQQLSGGEMQRVAIARAIVHGPALLVADEPTGNLDSESGQRVMSLLQEVHAETGVSILLATHSADVAGAADRVIAMRDGRLVSQERATRRDRPRVAG